MARGSQAAPEHGFRHGAGLLRRLDELVAAYRAMLDAIFDISGVSRLQYSVLAALARAQEGASGAWIARECGISRQAAHQVLQVLEGRHLVDSLGGRPLRSMNAASRT